MTKIPAQELGFETVTTCVPSVVLANPRHNGNEILRLTKEIESKAGVGIILFPELCLTGYSIEDLFRVSDIQKNTHDALNDLIYKSRNNFLSTIIVGAPFELNGALYNCAFVISSGKLFGVVPKTFIPNYGEFYEARWFKSGKREVESLSDPLLGKFSFGTDQIFCNARSRFNFAVELCEDLWSPIPPSSRNALAGANVIFNLSASNELVGKAQYRKELVAQQSARCMCGYVYASSGITESTKDVVFGGHCIIAENGEIIRNEQSFDFNSRYFSAQIDVGKLDHERRRTMTFGASQIEYSHTTQIFERKSESTKIFRTYSQTPFVPTNNDNQLYVRAAEIFGIQSAGLQRRMIASKCDGLVIGVSGGLDSTLALLVAHHATVTLGKSTDIIHAFTMPGMGTSDITLSCVNKLCSALGVKMKTIPIQPAVELHFLDIGHDNSVHDITYENSQARERTQILFDIANKRNALVVGTGDMSELALGWCTYNGDHMASYNVNACVPKTLVKHLIKSHQANRFPVQAGIHDALSEILNLPISPELLPTQDGKIAQITEDIVGPYILHDYFLFHFVRNGFSLKKIYVLACKSFEDDYSPLIIKKWLKVFVKRFFTQQFKRTTLPAGPKVGSVSLSPRGDWRMPDEIDPSSFLDEIDLY